MAKINPVPQIDIQYPNIIRSWVVVLTSALFFFYIFIQMNLFNAINADLIKELHFNSKQLGYLGSFYFYGNVIFLFPAGILLDRVSVRNILIIVFTISVIATYIFSVTSTFWIMNTARLILGLAGSFSFLSSVKLASKWFKPKHMAMVVGVIVTMAMFGGVIAQTPLALLTQSIGWRKAIQIVVAFGAVLIFAQIIFVQDKPKLIEQIKMIKINSGAINFWKSLKITVTNLQNWLSGVYIGLINFPILVLGGMWGVPYLTQVHHLTQVQATIVTTMLFIGMMIGSSLAGLISDRLRLRKLPMIIGAIISIGVMLVIIFTPTVPLWAEACQFFFLGLIVSTQVIGYPVVAESNPSSITATATSLASVLTMSGGMLIQPYSWLLGLASDAKITDKVADIYSLTDYTRANYLILGGFVVALIASLLIKETHCKQLK